MQWQGQKVPLKAGVFDQEKLGNWGHMLKGTMLKGKLL